MTMLAAVRRGEIAPTAVKVDVGERMVMCDGHCREWYHVRCVDYTGNKKWYCTNCTHVA